MKPFKAFTLKRVLIAACIIIILVKLNNCRRKTNEQRNSSSEQTQTQASGTSSTTADTTPPAATPPATTPSPTTPAESNDEHPTLTGLKFIGKGKVAPGLTPLYTPVEAEKTERYWYIWDSQTEMELMDVQDVKGLMIFCKGPVIYDFVITDPGQKGKSLKVRTGNLAIGKGQTWDESKKDWGPIHDFQYTSVQNISSLRVLKDKEDLTPSRIEIGIPSKMDNR